MAKVLIGNFKGPKGDKGDKGDPGTAATIQVGTTQTVQPEENAEVTNSGTANAAVLNFKIPRGEDGMTDLTAEYKDTSEYTCQPTVNAPVVVKELDGKTEQVETEGNQLFDIGVYNLTASRCNITQDGDYIIFKATDADAYFGDAAEQGQMRGQGTIPASPNTEYTVTISNSYFTKNYISFLDSNKRGIQNYMNFTSQSQSFTTPDNCAYILLRFGNGNSANGDTERLQIMLNKGSTALPWEPYTGGSPAPSPDYPQAIKGVGGMGYFDGEWRQGAYQAANGTWQASGNGICSQNPINAKAGDNVTLKYPDEAALVILAYKNDGTYLGNNAAQNAKEVSYTLPTDTAYVHIDVQIAQGVSITPSTAKYCTVTINGEYATGLETQGRNLINPSDTQGDSYSGLSMTNNNDGSFYFSGTNTNDGETIFHINLSKVLVSGTEYYLTVNNNKAVSDVSIRLYNNDTYSQNIIEQLDSINESTSFILSEGQTANRLTVRFSRSGTTNGGFTIKPMLSIVSSPQDFQPYHHTNHPPNLPALRRRQNLLRKARGKLC